MALANVLKFVRCCSAVGGKITRLARFG